MKSNTLSTSDTSLHTSMTSISNHNFRSSDLPMFNLKFIDQGFAEKILDKSELSYDLKSNSSSLSSTYDQDLKAKKYAEIIADMAVADDFVPGELSKTGLYLENLYRKDKALFRDCFQKAWLELFIRDERHMANFICIASTLDYDMLEDRADTLVIAGFSHVSTLVNEAVIRAVEMWEQEKHIEYLKNMRPANIGWLDNYKDSVIRDLERGL